MIPLILPVFFASAAFPAAFCQEEISTTPVQAEKRGVSKIAVLSAGTKAHSFVEGDHRVVLFLGGVHLSFEETELWADNVVLWCDRSTTDPKKLFESDNDFRFGLALPDGEKTTVHEKPPRQSSTRKKDFLTALQGSFSEIYAEGNIRMINGPETTTGASKIYFHLTENRGVIIEAELRTEILFRDKGNPIIVRAAEIRQVCADYSIARDAQASTCTYGRPHYHLRASEISLSGSRESGLVSTQNNRFDAGPAALPLPDFSFALGEDWPIPLKKFRIMRSSKFGTSFKALLGDDIKESGNAIHKALGLEEPIHGRWFLGVDLYGRRGLGIGPKIEYLSPGLYTGYLRGYYINDRASRDHRSVPIENKDRAWIQTRNRLFLPDSWLLDLELSYISEKHMLEEYFESEAKTDKGQETLAYIHRAKGNHFLSLLTKFRINDFDTDTERLPEARWSVSAAPVLDKKHGRLNTGLLSFHNIYYRHGFSASVLRHRTTDQAPVPRTMTRDRIIREDYLSILEAPFNVGSLRIMPFAEQRFSFYEKTRTDSHGAWRAIAGAGVSASLLLSRRSAAECELLGIDGLRQILQPALSYRNSTMGGAERRELFRFDEVDDATDNELITFDLRQRLQTRDGKGGVRTFFEAFYSIPAYPDLGESPRGKRFGNMNFDLLWEPDLPWSFMKNISINEEGEYNPYDNDLDAINSLLILNPVPGYRFHLSHRRVRRTYSWLSCGVTYIMTPRWEISLDIARDLDRDEWMRETLVLRRRAHQWIFEFEADIDRSDHNRGISISVTPLSLFGKKWRGRFYDPLYGN